MCYAKPGPRCSGHTLAAVKAATIALKEATPETRDKAKDNLAQAKGEYFTSPEGIKKNLADSVNPALTEEQRARAAKMASNGQALREKALREYKNSQAKKGKVPFSALSLQQQANIAYDATTPREVLAKLADPSVSESVVETAVSNPNFPDEKLMAVATTRGASVRQSIALRPNLPANVRNLLANDSVDHVRAGIAKMSTSPAYLSHAATDESSGVQAIVARNPATPAESLTMLGQHEEDTVRFGVAGNVNTPTETLAALSQDKDHLVRSQVAAHHKTSATTLTALSRDEDEDIRMAVARNSHTPSATLSILSKDEDWEVQEAALETLNS